MVVKYLISKNLRKPQNSLVGYYIEVSKFSCTFAACLWYKTIFTFNNYYKLQK